MGDLSSKDLKEGCVRVLFHFVSALPKPFSPSRSRPTSPPPSSYGMMVEFIIRPPRTSLWLAVVSGFCSCGCTLGQSSSEPRFPPPPPGMSYDDSDLGGRRMRQRHRNIQRTDIEVRNKRGLKLQCR